MNFIIKSLQEYLKRRKCLSLIEAIKISRHLTIPYYDFLDIANRNTSEIMKIIEKNGEETIPHYDFIFLDFIPEKGVKDLNSKDYNLLSYVTKMNIYGNYSQSCFDYLNYQRSKGGFKQLSFPSLVHDLKLLEGKLDYDKYKSGLLQEHLLKTLMTSIKSSPLFINENENYFSIYQILSSKYYDNREVKKAIIPMLNDSIIMHMKQMNKDRNWTDQIKDQNKLERILKIFYYNNIPLSENLLKEVIRMSDFHLFSIIKAISLTMNWHLSVGNRKFNYDLIKHTLNDRFSRLSKFQKILVYEFAVKMNYEISQKLFQYDKINSQ